ncbi:MAG: glutathione S-transferase family protein, partial [Alphaproteobacteria bacterium]|nr:glutathione S-transferase family protein [Alphaproteobacteria bacterium]
LEPDYLKLNPNGVVPTFVHDGTILIESSAILEYLEEVIPDPALAPGDAVGRARMRAWMRYIDEVPTVAVRVPTFANMLAPMRFAKSNDAEFAAHADRLPLRKQFYQRMSQNGFGKSELEYAEFQIRQTCERIEAAIQKNGGPWIMGKQYTMVDAQVTPLIDRMEDLGYGFLWEDDLPVMTAWFRRLQERPSYAAAFYPGARISQRYPEVYRTASDLKAERGF